MRSKIWHLGFIMTKPAIWTIEKDELENSSRASSGRVDFDMLCIRKSYKSRGKTASFDCYKYYFGNGFDYTKVEQNNKLQGPFRNLSK